MQTLYAQKNERKVKIIRAILEALKTENQRPKARGGQSLNKFKVVFHLENQVKAGVVLSNISNLITDIGVEHLEIQLVSYGEAVNVFVRNTSEYEPLLKDLANKKVEFCAGANAMHNFGIQRNDLLDFVTVDSDGGELHRKKAAGWSYIYQ